MNIHTSQTNSTIVRQKRVKKTYKGQLNFFYTGVIISVLGVFFFAVGFVYLKDGIEKLNRRSVKLNSRIHILDRNILYASKKRECFLGRYLLTQVKARKLNLRYPSAAQVRHCGSLRNVYAYLPAKGRQMREYVVSQR